MHLLWETSNKKLCNLHILKFYEGNKVGVLIVNIEGLKEGKVILILSQNSQRKSNVETGT